MKPGDVLETVIEKGVYRGRGLGHQDGRVIFVPRAHPGRPGAGAARRGPRRLGGGRARRGPRGGPGAASLALPVRAALRRLRLPGPLLRGAAAAEGVGAARVAGPGGSAVGRDGGGARRRPRGVGACARRSTSRPAREGLRLGLRQEGTRRVVDVEACLQLSERMNRAARALREALLDRPALWPRLRGLDLLESPDGGTLLAALETNLAASRGPGSGVARRARAGPRRLRRGDRPPAAVAARRAPRRGAGARGRAARARPVLLPGQPLPARAAGAHRGGPRAGGGLARDRPLRRRRPLRAAPRRPRGAGRPRRRVGARGGGGRPVGRAPQRPGSR